MVRFLGFFWLVGVVCLFVVLRCCLFVCWAFYSLGFGREEFIRVWWCMVFWKRGRAARLARGAHNPEVGSSNLLPATFCYLPVVEQGVFNALYSIRHLSKNSQKTYGKHLRRLAKDVDLNVSVKVEEFVYGLDCKNKTRNSYFMAYGHYCKANGIDWVRPNLKNERYPVKVPTEERINLIISREKGYTLA